MKWIKRPARHVSVIDMARHTLPLRLRAVRKFLRRAARRPLQDTEDVHQLRVATRRATAALELYKPLLSKKQFRWWKKRLRNLRRAAAAARDADVQLAYFGQRCEGTTRSVVLEQLKAQRQAAQPAIAQAARKLLRGSLFADRLQLVDKSLRKRGRRQPPPPLPTWARQQLTELAQKFLSAVPAHRDCPLEQLHAFRIQGKQLRYAVELLAFTFPKRLRRDVYPILEQLQEHLGGLNDALGRSQHLQCWHDGHLPNAPAIALQLAQWQQEQCRLVSDAQAAFWPWWQATAPQLQEHLARLQERRATNDEDE